MRVVSARWTRLLVGNAPCARSSHGLSAINSRAYLFGGESKARHAIDSTLHRLDITPQGTATWAPLLADHFVASWANKPRKSHASVWAICEHR